MNDTRPFGLVVPVLRNFEGLATLMASIDAPVRPYVLDNWNVNCGVARSWNEGLRSAIADGCTHVLICNDDVVLAPGALACLADFLDDPRHERCVAVSPRATDRRAHGVRSREAWEALREDKVDEHTDFSCFMVRPSFVDALGFFDENFYPAYGEDTDMRYRAGLAGLELRRTARAVMHHRGAATQYRLGRMPAVPWSAYQKNLQYYERKWGGAHQQERFLAPYGLPDKDFRYWHPVELSEQRTARTTIGDAGRGVVWNLRALRKRR